MPKDAGEVRQVNVFNEPYKAIIVWSAGGVKITVEAETREDEGGQAEADRRAMTIMDHFKILINSR